MELISRETSFDQVTKHANTPAPRSKTSFPSKATFALPMIARLYVSVLAVSANILACD
jgi:hypothetical protein